MEDSAALLVVDGLERNALEAEATARGFCVTRVFACTVEGLPQTLARVGDRDSAGAFDALFVATWDLPLSPRRLIRETAELVAAGIRLHSLSEPFLNDTPGAVFIWLDQLLSRRRRKAIKDGMRVGRPPGRPRKQVPERVLSMAAQGKSLSVISRTVGIPRSTLQRFIAQHRKASGCP